MIGISFAFAGSGLLSIADGVVRRPGSGDAGGLLGLALGVLRTQAAGPVFGSMTALFAPPENLAPAGLLLVTAVGAVTLMLLIASGRFTGRDARPWISRAARSVVRPSPGTPGRLSTI
jgi:cytochrome c biogenesis protein CcdA